mgnify:CR=1 FL=1|jgi:asparagine synthetase B (glutamine-hydrolysing)
MFLFYYFGSIVLDLFGKKTLKHLFFSGIIAGGITYIISYNLFDLQAAKIVAQHIGSIHHEINFTIQEGLDALRDVIYHIETYDVTMDAQMNKWVNYLILYMTIKLMMRLL